MRSGRKIHPAFYLMVVPVAILFFIFHTIPFLQGIFYSFTNWRGYGEWDFVGFKNYLHMFQDADILNSYVFTFKFAIISTILVNIIGLFLAIGLNSKIKFQKILKAVYFLPYMLGTLIIGFIFNFIFARLVPEFGIGAGIEALSVNILGTEYAWVGIVIVTVWQSLAFTTLIYLSGLQTVDQDIYEAADLDGASGFTLFRKITFPLLAPFFTINMVLSAKGFLMAFDQIVAMTNGGPGTSTTSISLLIYKKGFTGGQFAYQSANSVVLFLVVVIISIVQLRILEKREANMG
ncbi:MULTISPECIES: sugar ABC transporter permease [Vagococcus]|uniref:Multiple sugar ABC transporter, membrane-spanning permease protein MsmF n=1 Tax=Vagococcus fluvialis bH819 TaxID=1255619 RepID=A0A1X6WJV1_9ENTE|nr:MULTISPECIES: sugar ABC transporter permease [Vagococcus]SLM84583.1 Multiple sugar ABC transporter, membrane-spanning permease protein MsmF [Vagococcus fluvialis bH819]HCM89953.1 sugar ABC transporter permease [Vagococcus sp.]